MIDYRRFATSQAFQCLNCKPGYRRIFEASQVSKCQKIDNCSEDERYNKWMNGCAKCKYGYAWKVIFDNNNDPIIQYDECVWTKGDAHCLAFSEETYNQKNCVFCQNGYIINADGICEKFSAPLCEEN